MYKNIKQVLKLLSFKKKKTIYFNILFIYCDFFRVNEYWHCLTNCFVYIRSKSA